MEILQWAHVFNSELNQQVTDALIREVGVVDTIRFLNRYRTGHGDYTTQRDGLFQGMTTVDIINDIKTHREEKEGK